MKNPTTTYSTQKQGFLPLFISDYLNLLDPVFTFDQLMEEVELKKYLKSLPEHQLGRIRYNPVNMLKTILFGFMTSGYCSLRELQDNCRVNLRFMYLMDHETPSYRTFGYFINEVLADSIEDIFNDINRAMRPFFLSMNQWRTLIVLSFGYDPLECPICKHKMDFMELYYNHQHVSLEEMYRKAMSRSHRKRSSA